MLRDLADRANQPRENRAFTDLTAWEVREADDGKITFDGVASMVDTPYMVRDAFGEFEETIAKGSFRKTLADKADVRLLVNHTGVPLARTKSKTLKLTAAPDLRAVAELDPANPTVQEIRSAMSRGDLDQMSIGMRVHRQEWNEDYTARTIREAELFDVSVVTFPASPTTSAGLRSLSDLIGELPADLDEGELRRAIDHLRGLLPEPKPTLVGDVGPEIFIPDNRTVNPAEVIAAIRRYERDVLSAEPAPAATDGPDVPGSPSWRRLQAADLAIRIAALDAA